MSSKPFLRRKLAVAIGSASLLLPALSGISSVAQAQEAGFLEEVLVTARKTQESMQDAPVAVSAFSGAALKDAGYTNLQNLSQSVPGLTLDSGAGTGGAAAPYIRGVGQRNTDETLEGGVAIYIDGVYQGRPDGALMDFVDIANVQVLRGPQGTLFGKNATGGAMMVDTNKPTDEFEGNLLLRAGNYNRQDAQLTVNVPLIENTLYSRYSFSSVQMDGYMKQKYPGTDATYDNWNDEDRLTAQAQFRWLANDDVTVDFNYTWGKQREKGRGGHCLYTLDQPFAENPFDLGQPALPFTIGLVSGAVVNSPIGADFKAACKDQNYLDDNEFYSSIDGKYENDMKGFSTTVDWQLGSWAGLDDVGLKSITAWRYVQTTQNQDIDGTELPLIDRPWFTPRTSNQYSQEFQLNFTSMEGRLQGVTGLFLYNEQTKDGLQDSFVGPFAIDNALIPTYADYVAGPAAGTSGPFMTTDYYAVWMADRAQKLHTRTETAAVFSQLTYEVNEIVTVIGGLRYNWEKKGLNAAFYEAEANAGSGIVEANEPFPDANANGLSFKDIMGPLCGAPCDISALNPSFGSGFYIGDLIPGGTGFFVPQTLVAGPKAANAYVKNNIHREWIGNRSDSRIDTSLTPSFTVRFTGTDEFLDDLDLDTGMAYFTYSKGFKSGGIVAASILALQEYDPEKVDNYEIGFKIDALDRTLRTNVALYYMDYKDIQVTVAKADPLNPVDVGVLLSNAGIASISGVEWENIWLPFEGMLVQFNAAYTEAQYSKFDYSFVDGLGSTNSFDRALYGEPMPAVAEWTAYLALQYSFFGDFGALTPRVEASYKTAVSSHFDFLSYQEGNWAGDEGSIYNARLSWDLPDDKTRITAWVKNIENRQVSVGTGPIPEILGGGSSTVTPPRTYGVDFEYAF
ncbi:MAG TPA: TonB-dependent receptor [Pseudomonadales bacterium]